MEQIRQSERIFARIQQGDSKWLSEFI
jgi:hypothetical protein